MSQSNYVISNTTASSVRSQINSAFQAGVTLNSGATEPTTTYAGMIWHDTNSSILKMRTDADDAWINVAYVDQANELWSIIQGNKVVNTSGTEVGRLDVQPASAWETGTSTVESLVSPAKVKALIGAPAAGDTYTVYQMYGINYTSSSSATSYPSNGEDYPLGFEPGLSSRNFNLMCRVGGVARVKFEHRVTSTNTSYARVLLNGTEVDSWSTSSTSFQSRSTDVSVSSGDILTVQHHLNTNPGGITSEMRNLRITSSTEAYQAFGT